MDHARPRLDVVQQASGRWGWRYVDHARELELTGNDTFSSEEEAVHSARAAYPDIHDISIQSSGTEERPSGVKRGAEARRLVLALGATLAAALLLRALRDR